MKTYKLTLEEKSNQKIKRITPQLSCTLDNNSLEFINEMTLSMTQKKRKPCTVSQTMRRILQYCKSNQKELSDYL